MKIITTSLVITLFLIIGKFFVLPVFAATAINVPHYLTFEGQLTNSAGTYQTGTFSMVFTIYDALTGGTALWTETQPTVSVASGYFTAQLGSVTALSLDFSKQYWITVNVASDGEMTPRIPLNSVGYAYASDVTYSSYVTTTAPTASAGKLFYDSDDGNLYVYDGVGAAWRDLTAGVGGAGLTDNNAFTGQNTFSATTTMATSTMTGLLVSTTSTLQGTLNIGAVLQGGTPLVFEGATADDFETSFVITDPTADRTITFPDAGGMVLLSTTTTLPNLQVLLGLTNVTSTGITATNSNLGTVRAGLWNGTQIGPTFGGTGLTSYVIGDLLYASAANTLAALPTSTAGSVLQLSFTTGLPAYVTTSSLKIALTDTTGTLAVNRGGTNLTSYTANGLLYASDTGTIGQITTSTLGLLTTNVAEGSNKYWTDDRFDTRLATTTTLPNLTTLLGLTSVTSTGVTATNFWTTNLAYLNGGLIAGGTSSTISGLSVTSTGNLVSLLAPTYLRIGDAGATTQSLSANDDLFVSGKLEVDGNIFLDGSVTVKSTVSLTASAVVIPTDGYLSFGSNQPTDAAFSVTESKKQFELNLGSDTGRTLVVMDMDDRASDYNHPVQPDPTIFIHSSSSPAVSDQEYIGISVSSTLKQAIIQTGSSIDIGFSPAASSTVVMLLSTAGKLGIGTTVPSSSLHIVTSTEQLRLASNVSTGYLSLTHDGAQAVLDTGDNSGLRFSMYDTAASTATVASSTYLRFEASGWSTGTAAAANVSTTIQLVPVSGTSVFSYLQFTDTGTQYARFGKVGAATTPYLAGGVVDVLGTVDIGLVLGSVNNLNSESTDKLVSFKTNIGTAGGTELGYINASGTYWGKGGFGMIVGDPAAASTSLWIDDDSVGKTESGVMYIGNRTITTAASDIRMKENVKDTTINALGILNGLHIVDFDWKSGRRWGDNHQVTGMIAQELYGFLPQVVIKPDNPESMWAIDYPQMVPYVIKAVLEQQTQIQALSLNNLQGNLNGNANQDSLAVVDMNFQGKLKVKGQVTLGQDSVGQAKILAGATEAQVNFSEPYEYQPIVTLTLASDVYLTKYYVSSASSTGFIVKIEPQQTEKDVLFNWHAFGSDVVETPITPVEAPTIETQPSPPVASEPEQPAVPAPVPEAPSTEPPTVSEPEPHVVSAVEPLVVSEAEPPAPPQPVIEAPPAEPLVVSEAEPLVVSEAEPLVVSEAEPQN